ncbi:MAG: helix-turn-helix transcriptional regulator [Saprospiraceae bacterium]
MSDQNNTNQHHDQDMTTNQQTAIRIREERLRQNITQQAVAEYLGIDISTYSRLENGTVEITISRLEAIAEYFKVPVVTLLPANLNSSNTYYIENSNNSLNGNGNYNNINESGSELKRLVTELLSALKKI